MHFLQCMLLSYTITFVRTEHVSHLQSALSYRLSILPIGKVGKALRSWHPPFAACVLFNNGNLNMKQIRVPLISEDLLWVTVQPPDKSMYICTTKYNQREILFLCEKIMRPSTRQMHGADDAGNSLYIRRTRWNSGRVVRDMKNDEKDAHLFHVWSCAEINK